MRPCVTKKRVLDTKCAVYVQSLSIAEGLVKRENIKNRVGILCTAEYVHGHQTEVAVHHETPD